MNTPRVRIFAGPNGSGKSTFNSVIPAHLRGLYINPDDIERSIRETRYFDFSPFEIASRKHDAIEFIKKHPVLQKSSASLEKINSLFIEGDRLNFSGIEIDSYISSALSDFVRNCLVDARISFTFETVMSSPDKVALLVRAREEGFRVYVYYVATADPEINVARVQYRFSQGGHNVSPKKVRERYTRSLELLADAVLTSNRAYIFDNSDEGQPDLTHIAEITDGAEIEIKSDTQPPWFVEYVINKLT